MQRQGKACAKASWNIYQAAVKGKLKTTLALEDYHKNLKANFGLHPKFNKFFSLLQHEQEKTISKLRDLANCVPPPSLPPDPVRFIPDNTLCQDKLLCAIELEEQNKKLKQLSLIGETVAKHQAKESKIKKM
ncbi:hypothetical protein DSO57_1005599 [Entomophthora muscae]|uniref:Uncharacterized protein n=1 Tax=Entomophthora muscae TaxID=34485 RepID=A0ACC2RML3_9FUNG|nr:hypothetical protein DSO57_1005599 [Entomophthora muscae]